MKNSTSHKNRMHERYAHLISVEYDFSAPFARTIIVEYDSAKGMRRTCLVGKLNETNSEECTSIELLKKINRVQESINLKEASGYS